MPDPWDAFLRFDQQGRIEIVDRALIGRIQQLINTENAALRKKKNTLRMFYWSDTAPKQEVNALCVCRTHKYRS